LRHHCNVKMLFCVLYTKLGYKNTWSQNKYLKLQNQFLSIAGSLSSKCEDIDQASCQRLGTIKRDMCNDGCIVQACPRTCGKCGKLSDIWNDSWCKLELSIDASHVLLARYCITSFETFWRSFWRSTSTEQHI
jgi:hypothetical protein